MSQDNPHLECGLFILFPGQIWGLAYSSSTTPREREGHKLEVLSEARSPRRVGFVWPGHVAGGVFPRRVQLPLRWRLGL